MPHDDSETAKFASANSGDWDWNAWKTSWADEALGVLIPLVEADHRFENADVLVRRCLASRAKWQQGGSYAQVVTDINELCAAVELLKVTAPGGRMSYEPQLLATKKRIDFRIVDPDGARHWVEVKTVAPAWDDSDASWQRFQTLQANFPDNAKLIVQRELGGAGISAEKFKTRWAFITRSAEFEAVIDLLTDAERGTYRLLLVSNHGWRRDDLEDFADFYRTGAYRPDDWSRNAIAHAIKGDGIVYRRTISGFIFLRREFDQALAREFVLDIRGPGLNCYGR